MFFSMLVQELCQQQDVDFNASGFESFRHSTLVEVAAEYALNNDVRSLATILKRFVVSVP
jgi:hypothetical protein